MAMFMAWQWSGRILGLPSKKTGGGLRKERLPLYLAGYVWRYNNRNDRIQ